ncbi:hypothetical protein [Lysobacter gummosus]|uniref:hypothetical protein n=1 Tax=Lysobacter gummosus TaxID=262324 RepID=UPI0036381BD5
MDTASLKAPSRQRKAPDQSPVPSKRPDAAGAGELCRQRAAHASLLWASSWL